MDKKTELAEMPRCRYTLTKRNGKMINCLVVALGGAFGAVCRYLTGLVPLRINTQFPVKTLLINFAGSFIIGVIASLSQRTGGRLDPRLVLFIKVGFCGGFTTFSTFSLENVALMQNGLYGTAVLYMMLSLVCCIAGTAGAVTLFR